MTTLPAPSGVVPDPLRFQRTHVLNIGTTRTGDYIVRLSDGTSVSWDDWCSHICADLRRL